MGVHVPGPLLIHPRRLDLGDEPGVSQCLWSLGQCYYQQGQVDAARDSIDQAIALFRRLGNQFGLGWGLFTRAILALQLHDTPLARTTSVEALKIFANADDVTGKVLVLDCIAEVARREDDRLRAARLAGAAAAQEVTIGAGLGTIVGNREGWRTPVELTEAETAARAEGQKMNLDEAVAYALESDRAVEAGT